MECVICKSEFEGRVGAKTCSPKCRVTLNRRRSVVTDNVTLSKIPEEVKFRFTIAIKPSEEDLSVIKSKNKVRTASRWEEVPIAAIPVVSKGSPEMPDYMNGRQYFLWWKNNFAVSDEPETLGQPVILNPFKTHDNFKYEMGGETARRWGA